MGLRGQNSPGGPFVLCLWLVLWSSRCPQVLMPQKSNKNKENRPLFKRKTVDLWSCWADLNRRPHPYQFKKGCFLLSPPIVSYYPEPLRHNGYARSVVVSCCVFLITFLSCFLVPVWVLYGFLLEPIPPDLIPSFAAFPLQAVKICGILSVALLNCSGQPSRRGAPSWPSDLTKGGLPMMVTYSDLIQIGILIVGIIGLFLSHKKK